MTLSFLWIGNATVITGFEVLSIGAEGNHIRPPKQLIRRLNPELPSAFIT
jgi:hypothetical protein